MTAMLIRCKQKRTMSNGTKGSNIDMGDGTIIGFREDENGDHVAMVSNSKHLQRLLSIVEGYEIHALPEPVASVAAPVAKPDPVTATTPVKVLATATNLAAPAPKADAPVDPTVLKEPTRAPDTVTAPKDASDLAALDDDQIRAVYEAELKRKPHHNAKRETMVAQIEAMRAEAAATK